MFTKKLLIFIAAVAVTTMACGLNVNIPITTEIKTGPTVTEEINVPDPDPDAESVEVSIAFGAGELNIEPGAEALIEGTAAYNVEDFRPKVETTDGDVEPPEVIDSAYGVGTATVHALLGVSEDR